jgi:enoyl-CoA hydratase/carnithine racemase
VSYQTIAVERRGHVLAIALNRPDKRNAFNLQMLRELAAAYTELDRDDELRCGLLCAMGEHFTGGLDLAEVGPAVAKGDDLFPEDGIDPVGITGQRTRKPVVVAVQGYCLTIGIELILSADICVAAASTKFSQLEVGRGIMPFGGATLRFHQRCGWGNAMRWVLTGDFFDAQEAHRMGLVQELTEPGTEIERAREIAERIAAQAPLAVQATLANARQNLESAEAEGIGGMMQKARELMATEDAREGVQSFIERREASFKGR